MFTDVNEQTFCAHRQLGDIARFIPEVNAIVLASTFMDKDQLLEYLDAFLTGPFKELPMKFYIHWFLRTVNDWKHAWDDGKNCRLKVVELVKAGREIYTYGEGHNTEWTQDDFNYSQELRKRQKHSFHLMKYSEEHDLFYTDDKYDDLEHWVEEETKRAERKKQKS